MKKLISMALVMTAFAAFAVLGTTALFTDSQSVGSNTFTTGTIDISTAPTSAVVSYSGMVPGDSITAGLVASNDGNLQLRYAITASATNADTKALKDQLALTIKTIDVTTPGTQCDDFDGTQLYTGDLDSTAGALVGDTTAGADAGDRPLDAAGSETLCFRVSLPSNSGDSFQNATTTATFTFTAEQTVNN